MMFTRPKAGVKRGMFAVRAVYTHPAYRKQFYCAQRLLCAVIFHARAAGAAGLEITAQNPTILRDCKARGFQVRPHVLSSMASIFLCLCLFLCLCPLVRPPARSSTPAAVP